MRDYKSVGSLLNLTQTLRDLIEGLVICGRNVKTRRALLAGVRSELKWLTTHSARELFFFFVVIVYGIFSNNNDKTSKMIRIAFTHFN